MSVPFRRKILSEKAIYLDFRNICLNFLIICKSFNFYKGGSSYYF